MGDHTAFFYGTLMAPAVLYRVIYGTSDPTPFQRSLITTRPALLPNYRRHRIRDYDFPAIIPCPAPSPTAAITPTHPTPPVTSPTNHEEQQPTPPTPFSSVRGVLVSGLSDMDMFRLDIFEGSTYTRATVTAQLLTPTISLTDVFSDAELARAVQGTVHAQTYVWTADVGALEDQEWDFGEFVRLKMTAWMGGGGVDEKEEEEEAEVDEGFADVDRAVAALEAGREVDGKVDRAAGPGLKTTTQGKGKTEAKAKDPTGGRGLNGSITRQLEEVSGASSG